MSFDVDADVRDGLQAAQAAADQDKIAAIQTGDKIGATAGEDLPVKDWMSNLPKNITVGVMDAAANTVHAAKVFGEAAWQNMLRPGPAVRISNEGQGKPADGGDWESVREEALAHPAVQEVHGPIAQAYQQFRDHLAAGSSTSDEVTQGIAQFAIPLLGWSKILGVQKAISVTGALAEGATAATALAPHSGRTADMLALGKTVEGKLGQTLQAISPDGSALNAYINYMTDRTGESDAEGRFKNVIDSLVTTTAGAALLKTGAATIKVARQLPGYVAQNAGGGPVGTAAQEGKIVFHGTGSNFDEFSNDKIGTGEGNQTYGHGLYFAEEPGVARTYQQRLSAQAKPTSLETARNAVSAAGGDKVKAFTKLNDMANTEKDPQMRMSLGLAARMIKNGNVDRAAGHLMHVDIPDEHIANMLDHDKPMSAQPEILSKIPDSDKKQLEAVLEDHGQDGELDDYTGGQFRQIVERAINEGYLDHHAITGRVKEDGSSYLNSVGIPGIKYLDGKSRGSTQGTRNIVLFDAKHAKIVKKE